jgi:hypothetical protein
MESTVHMAQYLCLIVDSTRSPLSVLLDSCINRAKSFKSSELQFSVNKIYLKMINPSSE